MSRLIIILNMQTNETEISAKQSSNKKHLKSFMSGQVHRVLPTIRSIARNCPLEYRYPIEKVLRELSETFRINQLEATFFANMVRETKWNFREEIIIDNSELVNKTFCSINQQSELKSIILYLVLVIYTLKKFLNEYNEPFLEEAINICPNFESVFQKWSKKHSRLAKKFNPKTLNKIYQDIYFKADREKPNFNILVDSILEISPPYNCDFTKNKKLVHNEKFYQQKCLTQKYRKQRRLTTSQNSISIIKNEEILDNEINPIFSSERIHQMVEGVGLQHVMIEVSDFQAFGQSKIKNADFIFDRSVIGNSEFSGDQNNELKFEEQFSHDLRLGYQEGQNQQKIRANKEDADQSQNIVLTQSRLNLTDQYLNWKIEGNEYNY